ncbi:unnamed protein product [Dracunculus medinensis]|uniref:Sec3_C domain-containing protein n=1 Tax=Dracunculus medinensis TaxID=318479 RepID=A0A0N4U535_DRAME|nr:unnamed protein product [Dracunculus medinensis]
MSILRFFQPISAKEEADFRRLLARANLTIGDAEKFASILTEQLQLLDGANIQSIMDSEAAVSDLIALIDRTLEEVNHLDEQLDAFDKLLYHVRDNVEIIEEKDSLGCVERKNMRILRDSLAEFLSVIEIVSEEHIKILQAANLSDPTNISRCCAAARAMQTFWAKKVHPSLNLMLAYKERTELLSELTDSFVEKFMAHLSALFFNLNELIDTPDCHDLVLRKQSERFHALRPFSDLIGWLKNVRPVAYQNIIQRYVQNTKEIYKKEFDRFFESLNYELQRISISERKSTGENAENLKTRDNKFDRQALINLTEIIFGEIGPVVGAEQKFCLRFFHISGEILASVDNSSSVIGDNVDRNPDKQMFDQIKYLLSSLFESLHDHFDKFIKKCCAIQPSIILVIFVLLSKKALGLQNSTCFFSVMVFGRFVVLVKRQFDIFMDYVSHYLMEVRITKKMKIGLLDSIDYFKDVALTAEEAFADAERRTDLDRWYCQLLASLKKGIERAATSQYSKSPFTVVRFENYHHLFSVLSELKIDFLDNEKREARKVYLENLELYVKNSMGRPLEKIHIFFENVEEAMRRGVKADEIAFHQQFSKSELKKVISLYPSREVKKGLNQLYKKAEKHLVDDSQLLQVVWRHMQEEFIKQIKHYIQLIGQCYPNSNIDLEVSIEDVLNYFSQFALEH